MYLAILLCSQQQNPDLANNFLTHERHLFRSLQSDCAGGYLDSRPTIRLAGDGIPKAAGRAKQLMKNLPRGGCRQSPGEDFDFLRLSAGSTKVSGCITAFTFGSPRLHFYEMPTMPTDYRLLGRRSCIPVQALDSVAEKALIMT
jgi:hypothetical protein